MPERPTPYHLPHSTQLAGYAAIHAGDDRWLGMLLDISWCRFTGLGWYESGGRFLQSVPAMSAEVPTTE